MTGQIPTKLTKETLTSILSEQNESFLNKDRGIERTALIEVKEKVLSPLVTVITGLRRVGKSTILSQIADKYLKDKYYFLNFEDERLINFKSSDFDILYEVLISLFGEKKIFLLDEIQNIDGWERFVRRFSDQGFKFIITGSNASLLSSELGTRLTGRYVKIEVLPFSFCEFLRFKNKKVPNLNNPTTKERGLLQKLTNDYLKLGGIPDSLKYRDLSIHKNLYDDVLYRDIATRYGLENVKSLKELSFYLVSNISTLISFNKLKELLKLGSVNTVKNYFDYLENSWLFFVINKYSFSVKEQQIASKKVYCIDTGLAKSVGFSFSENKGRLMENAVFINLKRMGYEPYYYKTDSNYEVDFFLPKERELIQVVQNFDDQDVKDREIRAITEAANENKVKMKATIITESESEEINSIGVKIKIIPLYKWLLKN